MAEGTYEYECMRAELLGVDKPEYDEFLRRQKEEESQKVNQEEVDTENLKVADADGQEFNSVGGKLDELNNLLSLTQKKINNFKYRCSSVTSYMKSRLGSMSSSGSIDGSSVGAKKIVESDDETSNVKSETTTLEDTPQPKPIPPESERKSDLSKALDNHVDKLDTMLEKADNAQYRMQDQRKQMQSFLK